MKIFLMPLYIYIVTLTFFVIPQLLAEPGVTSSTTGVLGQQLATNLYCDTKGLFQGSLGMAIGMLMVFGGIWSMARGGKITGGIILLAFGGMFTALPSMIESTMGGLGNLLIQSGMSKASKFTPPNCSTPSKGATQKEIDEKYRCNSGGSICM